MRHERDAASARITRDTEDMVNSMVRDAETHMSDLRRQQSVLHEYVQRMRTLTSEAEALVAHTEPAEAKRSISA